MLKIYFGKAGTGKTAAITAEIKAAVERKEGKIIMIVPEQYSHEAERELCAVCGDSLCLYGEVLSFSRLAKQVSDDVGSSLPLLDPGGQLLCMALAAQMVSKELRLFSSAAEKPDLRRILLAAVKDVKAAAVSPTELAAAAELTDGSLSDKLFDLSLICSAYDAVAANGHADPSDRLTRLCEQIEDYPKALAGVKHIYVDGFTDFTRQEAKVLYAALEKGIELTVCFTLDKLAGGNEIFLPSVHSANALIRFAESVGICHEEISFDRCYGKQEVLSYFNDNMFDYAPVGEKISGEKCCALFIADSLTAECENAAAQILELVMSKGLRWRDIAVAVRGFDNYLPELRAVFQHYGIPLFCAKKTDLLSMPIPAFIIGLYKIICNGYEAGDILSLLHTGLAPLSPDECDLLENYIYKWNIKLAAWKTTEDWKWHPDGYNGTNSDESKARLECINELRRRLMAPIFRLEAAGLASRSAKAQVQALTDCLIEFNLPERLRRKADRLRELEQEPLAAEYVQLWDIICSALNQTVSILGEMPINMNSFGNLFASIFAAYDTTTIPVTLDAVCAGDFDRMRRRNIKYLLVLGASDDRLPKESEGDSFFTDAESRALQALPGCDIELGNGTENEIWREFNLIYNTLSLPSEGLIMSFCSSDSEGRKLRPAYVLSRLQSLLQLPIRPVDLSDCRMYAKAPALSLVSGVGNDRAVAEAVGELFGKDEKLLKIRKAADITRGSLSPDAVNALYGKSVRLSASGMESFSKCKFGYFCRYGLRAAKDNVEDGMPATQFGSFTHKCLEKVLSLVLAEPGGIDNAGIDRISELSSVVIDEVTAEMFPGFAQGSARFKYLFGIVCEDVKSIILDCCEELKRSDFRPASFEERFSDYGDKLSVNVTGTPDRIDIWEHEDKKYLRIIDYKTGTKTFSLSEVRYGRNLQLLLYLYALRELGLNGSEIIPAGVEYIPATSKFVSAESSAMSTEDADALRLKSLKRSGLCLELPEVLNAWEKGVDKIYSPVKYTKGGAPDSGSIVSSEKLELLFKHIAETCRNMSDELTAGEITAAPYYRSENDNACVHCEYKDACGFEDGVRGEKISYEPKLSSDEVWEILSEKEAGK